MAIAGEPSGDISSCDIVSITGLCDFRLGGVLGDLVRDRRRRRGDRLRRLGDRLRRLGDIDRRLGFDWGLPGLLRLRRELLRLLRRLGVLLRLRRFLREELRLRRRRVGVRLRLLSRRRDSEDFLLRSREVLRTRRSEAFSPLQ